MTNNFRSQVLSLIRRSMLVLLASAFIFASGSAAFAASAIWRSYFNAGKSSLKNHDEKSAHGFFQASLEEAERDKTVTAQQADSLFALASLCASQKDYIGAEPLLIRSLKISDQLFGPQSIASGFAHELLGDAALSQKKFGPGEANYRQAISSTESNVQYKKDTNRILGKLAEVYATQGKSVEAQALRQSGITDTIDYSKFVDDYAEATINSSSGSISSLSAVPSFGSSPDELDRKVAWWDNSTIEITANNSKKIADDAFAFSGLSITS